jgi:hypothetical protein
MKALAKQGAPTESNTFALPGSQSADQIGGLKQVRPEAFEGASIQERQQSAAAELARERARISTELTDAYLQEAERNLAAMQTEMLVKIDQKQRELQGEFMDKVAVMVRASAAYRAPRVIRIEIIHLTLGDETHRREIALAPNLAARLKDERDALEADLALNAAQLDVEFSKLELTNAAQFKQMVDEMNDRLKADRTRYESEITAKVRERIESISKPELRAMVEKPDLQAFSAPADQQTVLGVRVPAATAVPPTKLPESFDFERELNIWADVRGYKVTHVPSGAPDRTMEFLTWLNRK